MPQHRGMTMYRIVVEKTKGKYRVLIPNGKGKDVVWAKSLTHLTELEAHYGASNISYEKQLGVFRGVCTLPSGKKDIRWLHSVTAVGQFAAEYGLGPDAVKWVQMK